MAASSRGMTPQEYLEQERRAEYKNEYVNGYVCAMPRVNRYHSTITVHIGSALVTRLKKRKCDAFISNIRVKVETTGDYLYPDAGIICGEWLLEDAEQDTLLNPTLIVEVFSPSSEAYDRGEKFARYRRIPTMQEYVLVLQNEPSAEKYTRQGENWLLTVHADLDAVLELSSVDCRIPLQEIYDKVTFPDDENA